MSHLEDLLAQWYEWRGYIVRRNIKVGRLKHGGWEGELDKVAYHPTTRELVHVGPSIDAHSWETREKRFTKKFDSGKRHIYREVFPWLDRSTPLRQLAVLVSSGKDRRKLAGGDVMTVDEVVKQIKDDIATEGKMASGAIAEQFDLLLTIQLVLCGYYRAVQPQE